MKHMRLTRRQFIGTTSAGLLGLCCGRRSAAAAPPAARPNILLITTDQQRVDAMSALGNKWVQTPHLDALAAQGVSFRNSYCPYPLCSPSRAALHTSRPPHEIGVDHNRMAIHASIPISGQCFRAAGYDTAYAGKWHCPAVYPQDGIPGFEVLNRSERRGLTAYAVDAATLERAIRFLQRKHTKPFFLAVSFINPHDICLFAGGNSPLLGELERHYGPAPDAPTPPVPANLGATQHAPALIARRVRHPDWDHPRWRRYAYAYGRLMEDVDRQIGQVLAALRQTGQADNTLVVFTSDHGEGLGAHHWTGKLMFYEEEATVPLILSWKGAIPAGRLDREHLVSGLDCLPTICDYAGVQGPDIMRGQSLRRVIENPSAPGRECVVSEMALGGRGGARSFMVRTARYKYMSFPDGGQRAEMFFDLPADPGELDNRAGEPALAKEVARHRKLLAEWNQTTREAQCPALAAPERGVKRAAHARYFK